MTKSVFKSKKIQYTIKSDFYSKTLYLSLQNFILSVKVLCQSKINSWFGGMRFYKNFIVFFTLNEQK